MIRGRSLRRRWAGVIHGLGKRSLHSRDASSALQPHAPPATTDCIPHALHITSTQKEVAHPRKRFYRARAHSNPLNDASFDVPTRPEDYDW